MVHSSGNVVGRTRQGMDDDLIVSRIDADDGVWKTGHAVLGHKHVLFRRQGIAIMTVTGRNLNQHQFLDITGYRRLGDFNAFFLQGLGWSSCVSISLGWTISLIFV